MLGNWRYLLIGLLCCAAVCSVGTKGQSSSPPVATSQSGMLEGKRFDSTGTTAAFLGIPYALPPVGELRWRPPQPIGKWNGVRKATEFSGACPQLPARWFPTIAWGENCLYLNVWTPDPSAGKKFPVLVFFHGGSNTQGYGQMVPLGPTFVQRGLVVVSFNYRLGPFGFMAHPALTAESEHHSSGNYGLLDQLLALRWVRDNIAAFGGDPDRVTAMGQSAGAVDICLLVASPMAAKLFRAAILESGECQSVFNEDIRMPIPYNSINGTGEQSGERLAKDLGVANDSNVSAKLRLLSANEILEAWSKDKRVGFGAIVDGWVIPQQPAKIFAEGQQLHVPVLVGSNADEATVFGHGGPKTLSEFRKYLSEDTGAHAAEESRLYPTTVDADVPQQYLRLQSDAFAYGAYSMAKAMSRVGARAYLYNFTFTETGKRTDLGAYHGEELNFLSNTFPETWGHSSDDDKFGETLRSYWTQFIKTGDPNAAGLPKWAAYNERSNEWLELGRTIRESPVAARVRSVEGIMLEVLGDTAKAANKGPSILPMDSSSVAGTRRPAH
jgi:para-nitrobenzyl esterase